LAGGGLGKLVTSGISKMLAVWLVSSDGPYT